MADNSKDDFLQFLKRVGTFLTLKISHLFRNPDARSIGAIAGLAFAVVFTWRILRSPSGQRTQSKRQTTTVSTSSTSNPESGAGAVSSAVTNPSNDFKPQNVIDEFFQPVKPTLGQIVRQKLSDGRKVTCRLLDVILEESTPEELQKQATVKSSVLEVLLEITKFCDLYLMERVLDDESEVSREVNFIIGHSHGPYDLLSFLGNKNVLAALENAGVFTSGGLVKDKVLFCSKENGRMSFVRQLEPDWHIDSNPEIVTQLAKFIRYQLYISSYKLERPASNVLTAPSLEQYIGVV